MMDEQEFLARIKNRRGAGRYGIGVAAGYLRSLEGCLTGGLCPQAAFRLASPDQWGTALKKAQSRLVYCDPDMRAGEFKSPAAGIRLADPQAIMEFDCRITSTRQDRDGDVLESQGAIPDPLMPLLWQHIPLEPIGKLLEITRHETQFVDGRFAIADTTLGRDAALLVEFGALRISHGFRPLQYEPVFKKASGGEQEFVGFRVFEFEIMEASLVSVPSNTDAVITQFARSKLHHPAVKRWAKRFFENRKRHARGMVFSDPESHAAESHVVEPRHAVSERVTLAWPHLQVPAGGKGHVTVTYDMSGSRQPAENQPEPASRAQDADAWNADALRQQAQPAGGTEAAPGEAACAGSRAAEAAAGSERAADPPSAAVAANDCVAVARAAEAGARAEKAGRTLSRKNEDALTQACELLRECADREDLTRAAKAILREALGLVQGVLDQLPQPAVNEADESADSVESAPLDSEKQEPLAPSAAAQVIRDVLAGDLRTIERYRVFSRQLDATLDLRRLQWDDAELEALCAEFGL